MRYIDSVVPTPGEWRIRGVCLDPSHQKHPRYVEADVDVTGCSSVPEQDVALAMGEAACVFLRTIIDPAHRAEAGRLICGGIAKVVAEGMK